MEFRIDYGNLHPAPRTTNAPLWAAIDGRVSPLAGDEVVFFDPLTQRSHVMTHQVLQALDQCREFRPLDEHVAAVANTLPGLQGKQAAVRPVLESLQVRGLLISDDAYLRRLTDVATRPRAPMAGLFVRCCNRPQQVQALLDSLVADAARLSECERVVLIDDSSDPTAVAVHARSVASFAKHWPGPVHHLTPSLWKLLLTELQTEIPEQASALAGVLATSDSYRQRGTGGAGRNLATLLAAGARYLILDDDNLLPLTTLDGAQRRFDPRAAASTVRTYADQASALADGAAASDAIDWHLGACGAALGELLQPGQSLALASDALRGFAPSRRPGFSGAARVAVTINGHRGGSCTASPHWLLTLDARARAGLCADSDSYLRGRADPAVFAGFDRFYATRMATISPFAIDNSQLMPCTSPRTRAEDLIFLALASAADGSALQMLTPFTAGHAPEGGRDRSAQLRAPRRASLGLCIGELIGNLAGELHSATPAGRLRAVAARLDDLASGSDEALVAYLREFQVYDRVQLLTELQQASPAAQDAPQAFRDDIRTQIELNARAVMERGVPRFFELGDDASAADCVAAYRAEASCLADGLRAWPHAWEIALQRRESWLERARVSP